MESINRDLDGRAWSPGGGPAHVTGSITMANDGRVEPGLAWSDPVAAARVAIMARPTRGQSCMLAKFSKLVHMAVAAATTAI